LVSEEKTENSIKNEHDKVDDATMTQEPEKE